MKEIILIRHGKTENPSFRKQDHARKLKKRGIHEAFNVGELLKEKGFIPDIMLISSAIRVQQSVKEIQKSLDVPCETVDAIYSAYPSDILQLIQKQDSGHNRIAVVGHNPTLTDIINFTGYPLMNLPTAGTALIAFRSADSWGDIQWDKGELSELFIPKELFR